MRYEGDGPAVPGLLHRLHCDRHHRGPGRRPARHRVLGTRQTPRWLINFFLQQFWEILILTRMAGSLNRA